MAPPFNINNTSPADNALVSAFPNDERANRTLIEEWLSFISDPATGLIRASALPPAGADEIPSGSKMVFFQAAAPTGWTQDVTHNNKAIRIVNGTGGGAGGTTGFTTVFASRTPTGSNAAATQGGTIGNTAVSGTTDSTIAGGTIGNTTDTGTVGGTALTVANLPAHDHGVGTYAFSGSTSTDGAHTHTMPVDNAGTSVNVLSTTEVTNGGTGSGPQTGSSGSHSHTVSGSVSGTSGSTGSGTTHTHSLTMNAHNHSFTGSGHTHTFSTTAHNHSFTGSSHNHTWTGVAMDFAVQYVDMIICTRN